MRTLCSSQVGKLKNVPYTEDRDSGRECHVARSCVNAATFPAARWQHLSGLELVIFDLDSPHCVHCPPVGGPTMCRVPISLPSLGGGSGGGCTHRRPSQNKTSYQREASGVPDMRTHSSYVLRKDPMWASKCFMFPVFQALIFQQCNKNSHMWVSWRNEFMGRLRGRRENTLAVWVMGGCGYSCIRVFVLSACVHLGTATDH